MYRNIFRPLHMKFLKMRDPIMFQGSLRFPQYFEGWYYKLVSADEQHAFAFIPGISLDRKNSDSHCFIQVNDGNTGATYYFRYPLEAFEASENQFEVKIDSSLFSADRMVLDINGQGHCIKGAFEFSNPVPWRASLLAPGIMGPYSFVPFMECYHGLVSMNHQISGDLTIDGETFPMTGGQGYGEKDWGTSFPSGYLWVQSNHFPDQRASFMASIARIPWVRGHFTGFLAVLWHEGKLRTFTTWTGAALKELSIAQDRWQARIVDRRFCLDIDARKASFGKSETSAHTGGVLKSPKDGGMKSRIVESLTSTVSVRLFGRKTGEISQNPLFEGTGRRAGLEIEANAETLGF